MCLCVSVGMYVGICVCVGVYICVYTCMHVNTYCKCICVYACANVAAYICACMCIVCVCTCAYTCTHLLFLGGRERLFLKLFGLTLLWVDEHNPLGQHAANMALVVTHSRPGDCPHQSLPGDKGTI